MSIEIRKLVEGLLIPIEGIEKKALMDQTTNPGAMFTQNQIMIVNPSNETFTQEEIKGLQLLINIEQKGGQDVAESRN